MQIIPLRNRKKALQKAIKILHDGGVIAHPTDTCYGFAVSIFAKKAVAKLYALKKMSRKKPVSILVSSLQQAKKYVFWNSHAEILARKFWPGALTIIGKREKTLPLWLNPFSKTVGIRFPDDRFSQALVRALGSPITTTSANISGLPSPYKVSEILQQFRTQKIKPDLMIDGGSLKKENLPSTIIDISGKKPKILRQGKIVIPPMNVESAKPYSRKKLR